MTTEEKLEKLKKLADAMYYAAQYLTTDASSLRKTMEDYRQFIINEYHKEEPKPKFKVGDRIKFNGIHNEDVIRVITDIKEGEGGGFRYFFADGSIHSIGDDEIELVSEPVSGLDNGDMPIERWKQAVKAASNQRSYRSSKGLTETRDDYFVDGVQWADKHPKEEPVSEEIWEASKQYALRQVLASTDAEMSEQAYLDLRLFSGFELAVAHKDGAELQMQKLMKNAVECEYFDGSLFRNDLREKYRDCDKVKIVIVKSE